MDPLGGSRKGKGRTLLNLWLVFLATGFWHGAGWNFVVWGMIHGGFMILERLFLGQYLEKNPVKILNHLYSLLVVLFAWVFFRAETMGEAFAYLANMFGSGGGGTLGFRELFGNKCIFLSLVGLGLSLAVPEPVQLKVRENPVFRAVILPCVLLLCLTLLAADSYNPFIYFRF